MSENPQIEILSRFADIASIAGVRGKIDEELALVAAGFELEEGRSQMVFARALPEARTWPARQQPSASDHTTLSDMCHFTSCTVKDYWRMLADSPPPYTTAARTLGAAAAVAAMGPWRLGV